MASDAVSRFGAIANICRNREINCDSCGSSVLNCTFLHVQFKVTLQALVPTGAFFCPILALRTISPAREERRAVRRP